MKLIVGLGNPGMEYAVTRHNIGFQAIDTLAEVYNISVQRNKFKALIGEGTIKGERMILMKPQTYMNLSGEAIRQCMDWNKLTKDDIIVIYDDVSLEVAQLRIRKTGSAGGHNGIKSIINHLGSQDFARIKVGVGQKPPGWDLANYVLGRFTEEEMKAMGPKLKDIVKAVEVMLESGIDQAMNQYNLKVRR
ncbi:aminoacyl-tRNA hydrolase [Cellulosilyticum sp. I15G10I2]|uniref:aminoacyl-tRNA hydrolase n=1 Tax=Cellulosilyticum sp. I15G10I2 TaxID=1892843 RepID=UPI00085BCD35|nr:aminoacyl-tRNA hydrolase [Cellulosilyticum sp. I15G10I2]